MKPFVDFFQKMTVPSDSKIVMLILDGLGGLPLMPGGKTELETARTPNMDALAARSELGLTIPVGPGITPGSGPGHLAMFGYDPIQYEIGRGALEALGVDFELGSEDIAARGNFCTVDQNGILVDRRAGRLPTQESQKLVDLLRTIKIEGVEIIIEPVKEHRFVFILRSHGIGADITDMDPLRVGLAPLEAKAVSPDSLKTARIVNQFVQDAKQLLAPQPVANMILLRGFDRLPKVCLLYTSPSPRDRTRSRMPSSA